MALSPREILERLQGAGYTALYVGGMVRDQMLEREALDVDLATNAPYDVCEQLFADAHLDLTGKHFAVLRVDGHELAGFRGEHYAVPGKPEVWPASSFEADAARRDFTINAMGRDLDGVLYDPFDGQSDIKAELVRAVGDPEERFREDPIRILRALSLSARIFFTIEAETAAAMTRCAQLIAALPGERIAAEIHKAMDTKSLYFFIDTAEKLGLLEYIFPELAHLPGMDYAVREEYYEVWSHTITSMTFVETLCPGERALIWAALFRYCAVHLPVTQEVDEYGLTHTIGNEVLAGRVFKKVADRLNLGDALCHEVCFYLRWHMCWDYTGFGGVLRRINQYATYWPNLAALKEAVCKLYQLQEADNIVVRAPGARRQLRIMQFRYQVEERILAEVPFYYQDAGITGDKYVGQLEGAEIGRQLRRDLLVLQSDWMQRVYDYDKAPALPKYVDLPDDCVLRLATLEDVPQLRILVNAAYAELGAMGMNYLGVTQDDEVTASRMAGKEVWVIEKNSELIATMSLFGNAGKSDENEGPACEIGQFGVHPSMKRQGLGTHLLYHAFQRARDLNFSVVRLDTAVTAFHLVHLYRCFGFTTVYVDQWRRANYPSFIMEADSAFTLAAP